jgi:hypothetical protein
LESELIKALPNGGSLVIFVLVVMILTRQNQAAITAFQDQIKSLTDNLFGLAKDTQKALGDLTTAVKALEVTVEQIKRT